MQPLPKFQYLEPESLTEAALILRENGQQSMIIGGGTAMIPSLRQGINTPRYVVSLEAIANLKQIEWDQDAGLRLGTSVKLHSIAGDAVILRRIPILAQAAKAVGSPQLREMATLGGNLCLDTRCYYYNQSDEWRNCKQTCLKMGGEVCNVIRSDKRCFAVFSGDLAPALIALDAKITLLSTRGERTIEICDFYTGDGAKPLAIEPDELVIEVTVPKPKEGTWGTYFKYRIRKTLDYPLASVALMLQLKGADNVCEDVRLVIGAIGTQPLKVAGISELLQGKKLDEALIEKTAQLAKKSAKPVANTAGNRSHRRVMIHVYVKKAFEQVLKEINRFNSTA